MKVSAIITLKKEVLDPQGKVIKSALDGMGFNNIHEIRQGKYFEIDIDEKDKKKDWRTSWKHVQKTSSKSCNWRL